MIIGYQIEDNKGRNWHDNIDKTDNPRTVLTEVSALEHLANLHKTRPERGYRMIAVVQGEIDAPFFEDVLSATTDQFKAIGVSTSHIPPAQWDVLEKLSQDPEENMIMSRASG